MHKRYYIGVDVGGTNVKGLLAAADLTPLSFRSTPIRPQADTKPLDVVIGLIEDLLVDQALAPDQLGAIGVGIPGLVDAASGRVELAVNLAETSMPLGDILSDRFGVPVAVENDANAVAFGASRFLVSDDVKNLAFITLGTGVGAGLVLNGQIYHGTKNMAGEIGHMFVQESDVRCQCGSYGCLETFVAGPAFIRLAAAAVSETPETALRHYAQPDAAAVFTEAAKGDEAATAIVDQAALVLARALQSVMMSFDLEKIIIGGGISHAGDTLLQPILREWEIMSGRSVMAAEMLTPNTLVLCPTDYNAGAWGALAVGMNHTPDGRDQLNQAQRGVISPIA